MSKFFEKQYAALQQVQDTYGIASLGTMSSFTWNRDPKRLLFMLSRYKCVASILQGEEHVLEIGCGDSFASRIVCQQVKRLTVSDADTILIAEAMRLSSEPFKYDCLIHDFTKSQLYSDQVFTAAYLLDVLEHINPKDQDIFLRNICNSLMSNSKVVIGMPSLESQLYASKESKEGHVNCQSKIPLKESLLRVFSHVTVFSMNDEVMHTGFDKMSHYLIALCVK